MTGSFRFLTLLFTILIISGCDPNRITEETRDFEDQHWVYDSPQRFDFYIGETTMDYNLLLYLRYTNNFPFSNIYLRYTLSDPLKEIKVLEEIKNVDLFDSKNGKPLGKSSIGDIYEIEIPIMASYQFDSTGSYALQVSQFMRRDTLNELVSLGLRLEKADN